MYRIKIEKKKEIKKLRYTEINDSPSLFFLHAKMLSKSFVEIREIHDVTLEWLENDKEKLPLRNKSWKTFHACINKRIFILKSQR